MIPSALSPRRSSPPRLRLLLLPRQLPLLPNRRPRTSSVTILPGLWQTDVLQVLGLTPCLVAFPCCILAFSALILYPTCTVWRAFWSEVFVSLRG